MGGFLRNSAFKRLASEGELEIDIPSVWMAAMAERYPRSVDMDLPLSKRAIRKSAIRLTDAVRGSTPSPSHQT